MAETQKNNPLHGVTLKTVVEELVKIYGWDQLGRQFKMNCFWKDPSINSCLKFLRKHEWARKEVEEFYIQSL